MDHEALQCTGQDRTGPAQLTFSHAGALPFFWMDGEEKMEISLQFEGKP
jgi:hypothetical protein